MITLTDEQVQQIEVELKYARNVCAGNNWSTEGSDEAIAMLNKVKLREQAEQEPVAVVGFDTQSWRNLVDALTKLPDGTKLYAAPVRTRDLTDDEIATLWASDGFYRTPTDFARAVIATDRELNK